MKHTWRVIAQFDVTDEDAQRMVVGVPGYEDRGPEEYTEDNPPAPDDPRPALGRHNIRQDEVFIGCFVCEHPWGVGARGYPLSGRTHKPCPRWGAPMGWEAPGDRGARREGASRSGGPQQTVPLWLWKEVQGMPRKVSKPQGDEAILLCARWSPEWTERGGVHRKCHYCEASVVVSPSSRELLKDPPDGITVRICCSACGTSAGREAHGVELRLTPAMEKELKALSGVSAEDVIQRSGFLEKPIIDVLEEIKAREEREQDS